MWKTIILCLSLTFFSANSSAQESDYSALNKKSWWIEGQFAINFFDEDVARLSDNFISDGSIDDYFEGNFNPKLNYAVFDRFFIGMQAGLGYQDFERPEKSNFQAWNYAVGVQAQYYYPVVSTLYAYTELGIKFNHFSIEQGGLLAETQENFYKSYLDIGLSYVFETDWKVSLLLKDVVSYHSATPNFDRRRGWNLNNVFKDFIRFPHFSIAYRLN